MVFIYILPYLLEDNEMFLHKVLVGAIVFSKKALWKSSMKKTFFFKFFNKIQKNKERYVTLHKNH